MASRLTHYPVWLVSYFSLQDLSHHVIFIQTDNDPDIEGGHRFHVMGSLQQGMDTKLDCSIYYPLNTKSVEWMQHKGWLRHGDLERAREICSRVPPPAKQFRGARRLVKGPLRHCQHWVAEALDAMRAEGVLEPLGDHDNGGIIYRAGGNHTSTFVSVSDHQVV
ncbi:hypothetical protein QBC37DRAFT_380775 [Rhypophila decipiens]|uniref:Uncharacterized protein n=1 Tax=Rhypophila decipiens TaxID=261697 RepID=A0AAN6XTS7_9PEZI|nr:hypothetical protein QBC37DRAFT_380775 [Rhypophila decipiens]